MTIFDAFFTALSDPSTGDARPDTASPGNGGGGCGCGCDSHGAPEPLADDGGSVGEPVGLDRTLNAWTLAVPEAVGLFRAVGLDACCGGERTLAEACGRHGLDARRILARLHALAGTSGGSSYRG